MRVRVSESTPVVVEAIDRVCREFVCVIADLDRIISRHEKTCFYLLVVVEK